MISQFVIGLLIMVGLHELGHMLPAKLFGMRVEKFYIGFPPKLFGKKIGETEYGIGSIPLGGFVKISGMLDESMDKSQLAKPAQPWEFRSKPAWQRLIVMIGGVTVNAVLGISIFILLAFFVGDYYISKQEFNKHGIVAYKLGKELGFQTGDRILNVNGKDYQTYNELLDPKILLGSESYYTVLRGNETLKVVLPEQILNRMSNDKGQIETMFSYAFPFEVDELKKGDPAEKAGLKSKDRILAVNNVPIHYFHELPDELKKNKGKKVDILVQRGAEKLTVSPIVSDSGLIGFSPKNLMNYSHKEYGFAASVKVGVTRAINTVTLQLVVLKKLFSGQLNFMKNVSGPVGMAKMYGPSFDFVWFWQLTGLISMVLAIMNLLPIPALDGGHVMFILYEMIARRKPSERFVEAAQYAGMVLLLSFTAFVIYLDIARTL